MIRSTFSSFMTARSGILNSQLALDVVGNNMANVNTNGYTRQRVDLVSMYVGGYATRYAYGQRVGQGVHANGVGQMRDSTLDARFRGEYAGLGELDTRYDILSQLEGLMDEFADAGLATQLADLFTQLQTYGTERTSAEQEALVKASADLLAKLFNTTANSIGDLREATESQLDEVDIPRINDIFAQLEELNLSIRRAEAGGGQPLEMYDARNLLLDELSGYMDIKVTYTTDPNNSNIKNLNIDLKVSGGTNIPLMDKDSHVTLSTATGADGEKQILIDGVDQSDAFTRGALKGMLDMLNKSGELDDPASDVKGLGYYEKLLDTLAASIADVFNTVTGQTLFDTSDGSAGITAGNIRISEDWRDGLASIEPGKVEELIYEFNNSRDFSYNNGVNDIAIFTGTFQEMFGQICNILSAEVKSAKSMAETKALAVENVISMRENISAVSLDEEAINLLMFQKSYNAASRLMTTLDEALDQLINRTGIVGR